MGKKNNFIGIFIIIGLVFFTSSCNRKKEKLNAQEYIQYVEKKENGFFHEKKIGNVLFRLKSEPKYYKLAQAIIDDNLSGNKPKIEKYKTELGNQHYFILELENMRSETDLLTEGISDQNDYLLRVNYFSYDFDKDIHFVSGNDTLPCALFHYENSYGGTPKLRFLLSFAGKGSQQNEIVFEDKIFNSGTVKFNLSDEELNNTPELTY
jgi:hypothetical protein